MSTAILEEPPTKTPETEPPDLDLFSRKGKRSRPLFDPPIVRRAIVIPW